MKIHLIAIGGAVMHNLAIALRAAGHKITGSDDEIYNPARERLENAGLLPENLGWFPEKISEDLDLVILGMHARRDNPELVAAQNLGLPVMSYPEFIFEHSKKKKRIVIAGSHGKTTTVAMIMHVLKKQKMDFDYLVGASVEGFENTVRLSDAPIMVIEGDEYSVSPLDPRPKMVVYRPHIAVLTGIAWDHVNVYPKFEDYVKQFDQLISAIEPEGTLIWFKPDAEIQKLIEKRKAFANFFSLPYEPIPHTIIKGTMYVKLWGKPQVPMHAFGTHNLSNARAAAIVCGELGIKLEDFLIDLAFFKGAARRLQPILENDHGSVWQDFAHAPSKLRATIDAVKTLHTDRPLTAVFELHTFSSLNKDFLPQYQNAMAQAEHAIVFYDPHTLAMKKLPELDKKEVKSAFGEPHVEVFTNREDLEKRLRKKDFSGEKNLLLMSSGTFGGMDLEAVAEKFLK